MDEHPGLLWILFSLRGLDSTYAPPFPRMALEAREMRSLGEGTQGPNPEGCLLALQPPALPGPPPLQPGPSML